ncbi:hypothetical protein D9M73_130770 [compost metagenome]
MPRRALHHHAVSSAVAECAPLHEILAEGREGPFASLALTEIAGSKASERIFLGKLVDRSGCGVGLNGA